MSRSGWLFCLLIFCFSSIDSTRAFSLVNSDYSCPDTSLREIFTEPLTSNLIHWATIREDMGDRTLLDSTFVQGAFCQGERSRECLISLFRTAFVRQVDLYSLLLGQGMILLIPALPIPILYAASQHMRHWTYHNALYAFVGTLFLQLAGVYTVAKYGHEYLFPCKDALNKELLRLAQKMQLEVIQNFLANAFLEAHISGMMLNRPVSKSTTVENHIGVEEQELSSEDFIKLDASVFQESFSWQIIPANKEGMISFHIYLQRTTTGQFQVILEGGNRHYFITVDGLNLQPIVRYSLWLLTITTK